MLVVIEGPNGVGKTTVVEALTKRFSETRVVAFPNDSTLTGPLIRSYLREEWELTGRYKRKSVEEAMVFQCLQVVNRLELLPVLVFGRDREDVVMMLPRYWQSGWVYGQLDGLPAKWLSHIHQCLPQAQLNILLSAPLQVCAQRRQERDGDLDRYEDPELLEREYQLYHQLWDDHPEWLVVDTLGHTVTETADRVTGLIDEARKNHLETRS